MATIGFDNLGDPNYGEVARTTADPHFILNNSGLYTPGSSEEVYEVGFINGAVAGCSLEIGVYRTDTLARIATGTATGGSSGRIAQAITPVALTTGVQYCVAWRVVVDGNLLIYAGGTPGGGDRSATLTGANALPATFNPDGAVLDSSFSIFATTRASAGGANVSRLLLLGVG